MTLITGAERRRRWSAEQRSQILAAACAPGAVVADVARQADVCTSLIYKWRSQAREASGGAGFTPAMVVDDHPALTSPSSAAEAAAIVVELALGARVTISSTASAALITATIRALR